MVFIFQQHHTFFGNLFRQGTVCRIVIHFHGLFRIGERVIEQAGFEFGRQKTPHGIIHRFFFYQACFYRFFQRFAVKHTPVIGAEVTAGIDRAGGNDFFII